MGAVLGRAELYELFDGDPGPVVGFLRWLVEACGLGATPRVLEIGCGPGRLLVEFAGLGWDVEGLEPDTAYAERAVERTRGLDGVRVRRGGFANVDGEAAFDLVAAMNGPFSYLLTPEAREDAARRMHEALVPGGVAVVDFANFPWVLRNYREPEEAVRTHNGRTVRRTPVHTLDFHDGLWTHTDRFTVEHEDGDVEEVEVVHRLAMMGYPEVARVLRAAGFEDLRTYNGYEVRTSERLTGPRLLVSARKPPATGRADARRGDAGRGDPGHGV